MFLKIGNCCCYLTIVFIKNATYPSNDRCFIENMSERNWYSASMLNLSDDHPTYCMGLLMKNPEARFRTSTVDKLNNPDYLI